MINYKYECSVCGRNITSRRRMLTHMKDGKLRFEEHLGWMTYHVPTPPMVRSKNGTLVLDYEPLMEIVERECKIRE